MIFGLIFGPVFGLSGRLVGRLVLGLVLGLIGGLVGGLVGGLSGVSLTKNMRLTPNQGIHTSGWNALRLGLLFFLFFGLIVGLVGGLVVDQVGGLVVGLVIGLIVGLVGGGGAYFQHYVLRLFLAQSRALPWRVVLFLEEATGCILLQRVGGGYRFIHPLLQEYFAFLPLSLSKKSNFPQARRCV